ncbi:hypothetical protein OC834_004423 [Tilletia horrida]|nr:hypothetical protein OC834_004423 [Tilletia horrida]KAK0564009.1 hypothetical protein OC844_001913 [Tilletia horrida]
MQTIVHKSGAAQHTMVDYSDHVRRGHPISFFVLALWSLGIAVIASILTADYDKNPLKW